MQKRVQITMDEETLDQIDEAAEEAGENRSEYLARAGLLRSEDAAALTKAQRKALKALLQTFKKGKL